MAATEKFFPWLSGTLILKIEFQITSIHNLVQIKLDVAHGSTYVALHTNVNFGKFHSVCKFSIKENEKILLVKCTPHLVWNTAKKEMWLAYLWYWGFHNEMFLVLFCFFNHFSCSAKHAEALNEIFYITKEEGGSSYLYHGCHCCQP